MASGDIGQDELIETLENLFKMLSNKKRLSKQKKKSMDNVNSHLKTESNKDVSEKENDDLSKLNNGSSGNQNLKDEKKILLPEDRLTKEEVLKYLHSYMKNFHLESYKLDNEFINDSVVSLHYKHATEKQTHSSYSLSFDLETGKGELNYSYLGEEKGSFVSVTDIKKRFKQDDLIKYFNGIKKTSSDISVGKSASVKVNLVDSMASYAKTLKIDGYHVSSQSITNKQALIFLKHKTNLGDVMQLSYDIEKERGKLTHSLSNKENNYANKKTVKNEFTKADLVNHGFGKTIEQIQMERQKERLDTEDTSTENEIDYDEKFLESRLGKSVTKQVLSNPELLKGAITLYQLTSMRKLLANSKDQIENLNSLLNKKDVNFEEIASVKDNLSEQMDILQIKVSELEKNQETAQTFDKLNEGYMKDQDEEFTKTRENKVGRTVEVEHSM